MKMITKSVKIAVVVSALASTLTGCCLLGSNSNCCENCGKSCCCCSDNGHAKPDGAKKRGAGVSMTLGIGTDGIRAGGDANVGSHGASVNANAGLDKSGVNAGADAGIR